MAHHMSRNPWDCQVIPAIHMIKAYFLHEVFYQYWTLSKCVFIKYFFVNFIRNVAVILEELLQKVWDKYNYIFLMLI
jgi:hypothetical protein